MAARSNLILLVEDDPSDVDLIRWSVAKASLPVVLRNIADGTQAMDYLEKVEQGAEERPLLVLLDLNVAPRNGWEILAWMRSREALRDLPVAILTGSDNPHDRLRSREWQDIPFLQKTLSYSGLDQLVKALLIDHAPE